MPSQPLYLQPSVELDARREPVKVERTGITVLYEPNDPATVDILFIHGLQGHPRDTWTARENSDVEGVGHKAFRQIFSKDRSKARYHAIDDAPKAQDAVATYWPEDLLPKECPNARIMTFGYESNVTKFFGGSANQNTFYQHAKGLLYTLDRERRKDRTRPLVCIAHSMGGIILKQMLLDSSLSDGDVELQQIVNSTAALVFLGTPHRGSNWTGWGKIAASVVAATFFDVQKSNIENLDAHGECLSQLETSFGRLIYRRTFKIHSFQESKGMAGIRGLNSKIVEDWSSELGDPGRERLEPINANHTDMCRFYGRSDPGYQQVGGQIRDLVSEAEGERELADDSNRSKEEIMSSLYLPTVLGAHVSEAYDQTCTWIMYHDGYKKWQQQRKGLFWIKGKPGCGKSTLVKYLWQLHSKPKASGSDVDSAKKDHSREIAVSAAFFFNGRGTSLEQSSFGLYKSLLFQVLDQSPDLYLCFSKVLKAKHEELVKNTDESAKEPEIWNLQELEGIFTSIFKRKSIRLSITLFIDALDECHEDERDHVLTSLRQCIKSSEATDIRLSVCFSSRPNPEIEVGDCQSLTLQNENNRDIANFVQTYLTSSALGGRKTKYFQDFADQVIKKADGVFLWVSLVVPKLRKAINRGDTLARLRNMLDEIPTPLEELFEHILEKLDKDTLMDTIHIIRWTLFSNSTLNLDEFRYTFVAQPNCPCATLAEWKTSEEYIEDDEQMEQQIQSRCGGIVEVLKYDRDERTAPANRYSGLTPQMRRFSLSDSDYAYSHEPDNILQKKFEDRGIFYENNMTDANYDQVCKDEQVDMRPIYHVQMIHQTAKQYFIKGDGFKRLAAMIKNSQGNQMQNAFEYSLKNHYISSGHDYLARSCARYLMLPEVTTGFGKIWSVTSTAKDAHWQFPLEEYSSRLCFEHAGQADSHGLAQDHLYWAFKYLSEGALEVLLTIAAQYDIRSWIQLLKDDQTDFNTCQIGYGMPIKAAVKNGHLNMVTALIEYGSHVDGTKGIEQSTLSIAYSKGDEKMVELLTRKGATVDLKRRIETVTEETDKARSREAIMMLLKNVQFRNPLPPRVREEE